MKKTVSLMLVAALLLSISFSVFAATPGYDAGVEDNDFGRAIPLVAVTVPEPKAGMQVADAVPVPAEGARFTLKYQWFEMEGMTQNAVTTETFRAGGRYRLELEAIPNVAYWFEETTEVCVNESYCVYDTQERRSVTWHCEWDLWEYLREVYFPQFPEVKAGDPGLAEVYEPDHGKYTITCQYTDPQTNLPAETVETGKCYLLQMIAKPNPGYEFVPDTDVYVDDALFEGMCNIGGWVTVTRIVAIGLDTTENIHISIEEPQADTPLATTAEALQEGFTVGEYITWYGDADGNNQNGDEGVATVAEEGKFYYLQFYAYAADGYALAEDLDIQVNGKSAKLLYLENYGEYCYAVVNMGRVGEIPGDLNGDDFLTTDDAVTLLLHISMPDMFPLHEGVNADFTGDGIITTDDAVKLLLHISMPDMFPL